MNILGIYSGHDAGVAIVQDGRPVFSLSKERLTRKKGDHGDVSDCLAAALTATGLSPQDLDLVATSRPLLGFERTGRLTPASEYGKDEVFSEHEWEYEGARIRCLSIEHHVAHSALAHAMAPAGEQICFSVDGGGDFTDCMVTHASGRSMSGRAMTGRSMTVLGRPALKLGLAWNAAATTLGLEWFHGPGKVMGLAPYGKPMFYHDLKNYLGGLLDHLAIPEPRDIWQDKLEIMAGGNYLAEQRFEDAAGTYHGFPFAKNIVVKGDWRSDAAKDLASSIQRISEDSYICWAENLRALHHAGILCLSGGVALNPQLASHVAKYGGFSKVFVPPAPNDAGLALGLAFFAARLFDTAPEAVFETPPFDLGPSYSENEIERAIDGRGFHCHRPGDLAAFTAGRIAKGEIVAWFQGRSEIGPRALGKRSLLADPRSRAVRDDLNERIKKREWFRPYGASILLDEVDRWFDLPAPSPTMGFVGAIRGDCAGRIPAVVHVDGSCRLQTVAPRGDALFASLLDEFRRVAEVPLLLNTSLNCPGEPLVESPAHAVAAFESMDIHGMAIGPFYVSKKDL